MTGTITRAARFVTSQALTIVDSADPSVYPILDPGIYCLTPEEWVALLDDLCDGLLTWSVSGGLLSATAQEGHTATLTWSQVSGDLGHDLADLLGQPSHDSITSTAGSTVDLERAILGYWTGDVHSTFGGSRTSEFIGHSEIFGSARQKDAKIREQSTVMLWIAKVEDIETPVRDLYSLADDWVSGQIRVVIDDLDLGACLIPDSWECAPEILDAENVRLEVDLWRLA